MKKAANTFSAFAAGALLLVSGAALAEFRPGMDASAIQSEVRSRLARGESPAAVAAAGVALLRGDEARLAPGSCTPFSAVERLTVALLTETASQGPASQRSVLSSLAGSFKASDTAVACIYQASLAVGVGSELAVQAVTEGSGDVGFLSALPATAAGPGGSNPPGNVGSQQSVVAGVSRGASGFNNGFGFTLGATLGGGGGRGISRN